MLKLPLQVITSILSVALRVVQEQIASKILATSVKGFTKPTVDRQHISQGNYCFGSRTNRLSGQLNPTLRPIDRRHVTHIMPAYGMHTYTSANELSS